MVKRLADAGPCYQCNGPGNFHEEVANRVVPVQVKRMPVGIAGIAGTNLTLIPNHGIGLVAALLRLQ